MRVGIVGCGKIAHRHASLLPRIVPGAQLIFCDRNIERAESLAGDNASPGSVFSDVGTMLDEADLDTVHVLTQVSSHSDIAEAALRAKAHVYVEKPVVETQTDFRHLVSVAEEENRHLAAGYSALGSPGLQQARSLIASGDHGELVSVHCDYNWAANDGALLYEGGHHWAYRLRGGILQNLADHPASLVIDALHGVTDSSVHVGWRQDLPHGSPDFLHAAVRNTSQVGSFTMVLGNGNTQAVINYFLERATIRIDLRSDLVLLIPGSGPQSLPRRTLIDVRTSLRQGFKASSHLVNRLAGRAANEPGVDGLITNFYDVINGSAPPLVRNETVSDVLGLLETAWETAAGGRVHQDG